MSEAPVISSSPDSASTAPRSLWILGSGLDLLLIIATPLLIFPLILGAHSRWSAEDIFLFVSTFGAVGHHAPGLMRAYGDRTLFRRFRTRFVLVPVVTIAVCMFFTLENLNGVMLVLLTWGVWHFLMQTYGFARIYDAKIGCSDAATRRLDLAMCIAWFGACVLFSDDRLRQLVTLLYDVGFPVRFHVPIGGLRGVWGAGTVVITLLFIFNLIRKAVRGESLNPAKLLLLGVTFCFFWVCSVTFTNLVIGVAMFEVYHDIQYLTIVWAFNRRRAESNPGVGAFTRFLFRRSGALIGLYVGIVLAYGSIGFAAERLTSEGLQRFLFGLIGASNVLHFYYDGFIWKVREPSTRQSLGVASAQSLTDRQRLLPGWFAHGLKWSVLGLIVLVLGTAERSRTASELDRARAVVAVTPNAVAARTALAKALIDDGRPEEAIEECRHAERIEPDHYQTYMYWGAALSDTGDDPAALPKLNHAMEMHPSDVYLRFHLAMVHLKQGRLNLAAEHLKASLDIRPDDPDVHYNLGLVRAMQGRLEEASAHFSRALDYDPEHVFAMSSLAEMSRLQGRTEDAVHQYRATLELDPDFPNAHYGLAASLRAGGELDEANRHLAQGVELILSAEKRSVRDSENSITWAEELVALTDRQDAHALDLLARAYLANERYADAVEAARSAVNIAAQTGQHRFADEIGRRMDTYAQSEAP